MANAGTPFEPTALAPLPVPPAVMTQLHLLLQSTFSLQLFTPQAEAVLQLLAQGAASSPPPANENGGGGRILCFVSNGPNWALGGGLLLAASQSAGGAGGTLAVFTADSSAVLDKFGEAMGTAFPGEHLAVNLADPVGCHVVLVGGEDKVTARGARAALLRAREIAKSGVRTFLVSTHCGEEEGERAFDAAAARGELDVVSRLEGAAFCAGWIT